MMVILAFAMPQTEFFPNFMLDLFQMKMHSIISTKAQKASQAFVSLMKTWADTCSAP